jgi:hypothetical protein
MKAKQQEIPESETDKKRRVIEETLETHKTVLKKLAKI